jgi:hypothetical protein
VFSTALATKPGAVGAAYVEIRIDAPTAPIVEYQLGAPRIGFSAASSRSSATHFAETGSLGCQLLQLMANAIEIESKRPLPHRHRGRATRAPTPASTAGIRVPGETSGRPDPARRESQSDAERGAAVLRNFRLASIAFCAAISSAAAIAAGQSDRK